MANNVDNSLSEEDSQESFELNPDSNKGWIRRGIELFMSKVVTLVHPSTNFLSSALMPVERDAQEYNMTHRERGRAIIFNNKEFLSGLDPRLGSNADRDELKDCLLKLGFEVEVHEDATVNEISDVLFELSNEDHSNRDCILIAVFSHGKQDKIHAYNGKYKTKILWEHFEANRCPTLAGKPKIFLIQACQGDQYDYGTVLRGRTETDGNSSDNGYSVPNTADVLTVYSTVPGYFSFRSAREGTWFIQSVCKVFNRYSESKDLLSMMTIISRNVALNYKSYVHDRPDLSGYKQMPWITSTLIRDVYFR